MWIIFQNYGKLFFKVNIAKKNKLICNIKKLCGEDNFNTEIYNVYILIYITLYKIEN